MNKLPQELRLLIGQKLGEDDWTLDAIMVVFETEVTNRESTATAVSHHITPKPTKPSASNRTCPTLNSFMTTNQVSCAYCSQSHPSASCRLISTVEDRKQALMKSGRCFNCLRRGHIGRDCLSSTKCNTFSGRHHISICAHSTRKTSLHQHHLLCLVPLLPIPAWILRLLFFYKPPEPELATRLQISLQKFV